MTKDLDHIRGTTRRGALLLAPILVVHAATWPIGAGAQGTKREARAPRAKGHQTPSGVILGRGAEGLPPAALDTRGALMAAVESGDIDELKPAMEIGDLKPEVGAPAEVDPIAHLKSLSADGSGKDILALIGRLLEGGWAAIPGGRDVENNQIYVWPHLAEIPLGKPSEEDRKALEALVGADAARGMIERKRYRGWRLSIGADGVWHMLTRVGG